MKRTEKKRPSWIRRVGPSARFLGRTANWLFLLGAPIHRPLRQGRPFSRLRRVVSSDPPVLSPLGGKRPGWLSSHKCFPFLLVARTTPPHEPANPVGLFILCLFSLYFVILFVFYFLI